MSNKTTKKEGASAPSTESLVNVSHLSKKFGLDPKKVRAIIRGLGYNAPPVKEPQPNNFGPKNKYEFDKNSKELKEIEKALKAHNSPPND